jgi:hypothetical protein
MSRYILSFAIIISFSGVTYAKSILNFHGEKFKAVIEYDCNEGNLTCDKVFLKSTRLKDNSSIELKGATINTNCPDVCDFQGYEFDNGKYNYAFYPSLKGNDVWDYIITENENVIAQDSGVMK